MAHPVKKYFSRIQIFNLFFIFILLASCSFHLQGEAALSPALHHLLLQTDDPYGTIATQLKSYLKMSHVELVEFPHQASAVLVIVEDSAGQDLLGVSGTTQTRQYNLHVTVVFQIVDATGKIILAPQTLTENRTLTVQSNQILGSSNESTLFYQQMRRTLAYSIMYRIASRDVTQIINDFFITHAKQKS